MTEKNESDAVFWERIADMPLLEAEISLVERRNAAVARKGEVLAAMQEARKRRDEQEASKCGREVASIDKLLTALNERIPMIRRLQTKMEWKNAVLALYGKDACQDCIMWIEQNYGEKSEARKEWAAKAREMVK